MAKNHPVHDRAHPALSEGREPMDTKRTEDGGGVRPGKGGGKGGGIYHDDVPCCKHSELQGKHGGDVGVKQTYERKGETFTQPEGPAGASNMTESHRGMGTKAEHHKSPSHEPHRFDRPGTKGAHGYGHDATQRHGVYRHSGNPKAHRIGKRGK